MSGINPVNSSSSPSFETYLESWDGNWQKALNAFLNDPNFKPGATVDISFGNFTFSTDPSGNITGIGGLQMSLADFQTAIDESHAKGGKVKLALGGATYGASGHMNAETAALAAQTVKQFNLDGLDLDIEDAPNPQDEIAFIHSLRTDLGPDKSISLTIPGQDSYVYTNILPFVKGDVTQFNIMEYDIWPGSNYVDQIKADIQSLIASGVDPSQINLGLMPGKDDMGHDLSVSDAANLAAFAKSDGLVGVFIWDADRDYQGIDGNPSNAYTDAIEQSFQGAAAV